MAPEQRRPEFKISSKRHRYSIGLVFLCASWLLSAEAAEAPGGYEPLKLNGTKCTVREPLYNHTFDFSSLSSDLQHHVMSDEENPERFFFNVCDDSEAFLKQAGGNVSLGRQPALLFDEGRIQFRFEGAPCGTTGSVHSLEIILICRYEHNPDELRVVPYAPGSCRYFIFWDTPLACLPLPDPVRNNNCTVQDGTYEYSLLELGRENHEVHLANGSKFILSVCKPVHYSHEAMCPPGSSVCFVNATEPVRARRYRDFGQAVANPTLNAQGVLEMRMRSGSEQGCGGESRIVFRCGSSPDVVKYLGQKNCTHEFEWSTELACRNVTRSCALNKLVDLSPLANRTYPVTAAGNNHTYELAVCNAPSLGYRCDPSWGACETHPGNGTQTTSLGLLNDELHFDKNPYLQYRSGAGCTANGTHWETRIEFICDRTRSQPLVVVAEDSDCLLVVHFVTSYACLGQLDCGAYNASSPDQFIDLSPLVRSDGNYEAHLGPGIPNTHRYFINVCRPLVPQYGLSCRGGAAACETIFDGQTQRNETTLGYPEVQPVVVGDTVLLKYFHGEPCRHDPHTNLSTSITFRCVPSAGAGEPHLVEIANECHYRFDWPTSVICGPTHNTTPTPPPPTPPASPTDIRFEPKNCSFYNPTTAVWANMNDVFVGTEMGDLCERSPVASIDGRTPDALDVHFSDQDATSCRDSGGKRYYNITITCGENKSPERTARGLRSVVKWFKTAR
ncbi:cation-independent mannose-6-phosphate receptor [Anopheles ziemanni]|uniref:cation-independent mannose-6-phosphate receptor n=2 Tax=coustani group TaxID=59130 RepID=UPI00265EA533|nr:cation-independent mannose-6-phosphate receptor [Anopheles ziemanni]